MLLNSMSGFFNEDDVLIFKQKVFVSVNRTKKKNRKRKKKMFPIFSGSSKIGKTIGASKTLVTSKTNGTTTSSHASIGALSKNITNSNNNNASNSVANPSSSSSITLNSNMFNASSSRFFKQNQQQAEQRIKSIVHGIEDHAARQIKHQQQQQQQPAKWWFFHGPQFGWHSSPPQNLAVAAQQQHRQQSSFQQGSYPQSQSSPKQHNSMTQMIAGMIFPWFVFFLVVGEMADYFIGELAIGTATSTTTSASSAGKKVVIKAGAEFAAEEKKK